MKKPLFDILGAATVENLALKDVNISGKTDIGALANEANNATRINNVHVDGVLAGERGIGGLVWKADNSKITTAVSREELSTPMKRGLHTISEDW